MPMRKRTVRRPGQISTSRILIGKKSIQDAMGGIGWARVMRYIREGAPVYKGAGQNDTYESHLDLIYEWWRERIKALGEFN